MPRSLPTPSTKCEGKEIKYESEQEYKLQRFREIRGSEEGRNETETDVVTPCEEFQQYTRDYLWLSEEVEKLFIFFLFGHFVVGSERMTKVNGRNATVANKDVFRTDVPMNNVSTMNGGQCIKSCFAVFCMKMSSPTQAPYIKNSPLK